jgi:hypothetical protein
MARSQCDTSLVVYCLFLCKMTDQYYTCTQLLLLQAVQKLLFFPPLICPCDGAHYKPRMCITRLKVFLCSTKMCLGSTKTPLDRTKGQSGKKKRCRQNFLYCLQIRTPYVHILYLPLMFDKSCQNNNNFEKNKSLAALV